MANGHAGRGTVPTTLPRKPNLRKDLRSDTGRRWREKCTALLVEWMVNTSNRIRVRLGR